ncbi:MAG: Holliday junction branch migration protein RuvA [Nitrospinota bacterium]|nr:Holliday junction branch migration protein RuvA [Nitrospinota bacterium]
MINKISGKIEEIQDDTVCLTNVTGITYEMYIGEYAVPEIHTKMLENETVELYTFHYLEGNVTSSQMIPRLVGFLTKEERDFFIRFIKVPGISPRSATKALGIPPQLIAEAIANSNLLVLTKLSGIGKKKAEQIVSKLQSQEFDQIFKSKIGERVSKPTNKDSNTSEAIEVLVSQLGYKITEAENLVIRALEKVEGEASTEVILEEVFRLSN